VITAKKPVVEHQHITFHYRSLMSRCVCKRNKSFAIELRNICQTHDFNGGFICLCVLKRLRLVVFNLHTRIPVKYFLTRGSPFTTVYLLHM
jgi:hypothetical protein